MRAAAILLCAGRGERLGAPGGGKALAALAGRPLFAWSLDVLERAPVIEAIVLVGPPAKLRAALDAAGITPRKVVAMCDGGRERQHSVANGLAALPPEFDLVAVHDAARALITPDLVARCVADGMECGAAIAAVPIEDTIKRAALGVIEATVPRQSLWRAQTPQVFRRDWLEQAHREAAGVATDDAGLVEALGHRVRITPGDPLNFKITTPADLALAEAWLASSTARS